MASTVTMPASTRQISYDDLYARWEAGNWSATALDFSQDRIDWHERMTEEQRRGALWLYTLFFHGEESVTDNLSPYIDAAPLEEQKYFLCTQQVDEARHSIFFKRFMAEVVGVGDGTAGGTLRATIGELTWGHRQVFGHLDDVAARLQKDRSRRMLAEAVTLYHIVVEASLAQSGQHMIDSSLERLDLLPGFREGMRNVSFDEQRHIAFGVRLLADLVEEDPSLADVIVDKIGEVMPWTIAVALPPGWDRTYTESFGFTIEELYVEGARAQDSRLRAIGLTEEHLARLPFPVDRPFEERVERGLAMLRARYVGPKDGAVRYEEPAAEYLFDGMARTARGEVLPSGTTIQWSFPDGEPWQLIADNGATRVERGRAASPDLTLEARFEDLVDMTAGRVDPRRLLLTRRLRPKGSLKVLAKLPRVFA
jgi:ribonucleotide reductase beta subunit family protein with ferritin-like domain